MIKDYFLLAFRGIVKRGLRSWLTMIGIFIGIAAVVSLIGLGEGLREAINSQFGFLGTNYISVMASGGFGPPGTGVIKPLTDKEISAIKKISGVEGAAGRMIESTKIEFNKMVSFGYAVSMPSGEDRKLIEEAINLKAVEGRLLEDSDTYSVFLGYNFMKDDNVFGKAILPGATVKIQDKEFKVVGIMEKKGNFQLDSAIVINDDVFRDVFNRPGKDVDVIAVKFNENSDLRKIEADISKELRKIRKVNEGEEDFSVQTPAKILQNVNSTLLAVQIFIYIIAGISLLVGGIGIMNTMYTSVVERTKEIGIMKSIGAKNSTIFSIFLIESGLLGSVGGIVGTIIGFLLAEGLAFVGRILTGSALIQTHFTYQLIIGAILFAYVLGSLFGTLPARRASKLNPVDALRFTK